MDQWQQQARWDGFVAQHGEPVPIENGVWCFKDGAVAVQGIDRKMEFRDPPADPVRRLRVQRDWRRKRLEQAEAAFYRLKGRGSVSAEVRDELLRLRDEVREHREALAAIVAQLEQTPEEQARLEQERVRETTRLMFAQQEAMIRTEISEITIDD